jgi:hypothetical protein
MKKNENKIRKRGRKSEREKLIQEIQEAVDRGEIEIIEEEIDGIKILSFVRKEKEE